MRPEIRRPCSCTFRFACGFPIALAAVLTVCASVAAHGVFEKVLFSGKANYATRGSVPGTAATTLYAMQPKEFMTGQHDTVGWRFTMQDADASTAESVRLSWVRYAQDGKSPDTSAAGEVYAAKVNLFGLGLSGNIAYDFTISIGIPQTLPATIGIGIELPANSLWPRDGAAIHAQLNVPNDALRPRISAPWDKEVWTFEHMASGPQPLFGRTLDSLYIGGLFVEPTLTPFIDTTAYGSVRPERLYGVDALFPDSRRNDYFGLQLDGGQVGSNGFGILYTAAGLNKSPIKLAYGEFSLSLTAPEPWFVMLVPLDSLGSTTIGPHSFFNLPLTYREFWLQALVVSPFSLEVEASDAIKIRGS